MADLRRDDKRWLEAAALYREYLGLKPMNAAMWVQFGHALKESGQLGEAETAYRQALMLQPSVSDTHLQLGHLLRLRGRIDEASKAFARAIELDRASPTGSLRVSADGEWAAVDVDAQYVIEAVDEADLPTSSDDTDATDEPTLLFDVSDLISYFRNDRLPTGIQRVQMEVISALLREPQNTHESIGICAFAERRDLWARIPNTLFLQACELSLSGGDTSETNWVTTIGEVTSIVQRSRPMKIGTSSVLVNLGTSWLPNYHLNVRNAKAQYDIRYIPFVHDLVPIVTPEYSVRELREDFVAWILGVFEFADHFLVNSEATRTDLLSVARQLGHELSKDAISVVPLNADFRKARTSKPSLETLRKWNLKPSDYVLLVSTIEPRKNHIGAFSAWLALMRKHGAAQIPKLVCVGKDGWLNEEVYAKLDESDDLRSQVVILSKVSDDDLALLYDNSLFTFYPSHYEGWGLPVTEALCHGKIPLISAVSSLPEAGGKFADYFEANSEPEMLRALERLIFDAPHRLAREQYIREAFRPRSWLTIGTQVEQAALQVRQLPRSKDQAIVTAQFAVFYSTKRNREARTWPGMKFGELFLAGEGWCSPEDWGIWTKPGGGGIALRIAGPHRGLRAYFALHGLRTVATSWSLEFDTSAVMKGTIAPGEKKWVSCEFHASETDTIIRGIMRGDKCQYLSRFPGSIEAKLTSIGFGGFYICETEDMIARGSFMEAVLLDEMTRLEAGARARDSLPAA